MDVRISAGDQQATERVASLEQALAALRADMPSAGDFRGIVDDNLRRHAEQVGALDQKLTALQEELPPKIKAIVDAVRESLDARLAVELQGIEERQGAQNQQAEARIGEAQEQFRQQLAAESKTPALEQSVAQLRADLAAMDARLETSGRQSAEHLSGLEQHAARITAGVAAEMEALQARHRTEIDQLESRLRAEKAEENIPAQINSAVAGLRQTLEAKLAAEIHDLEARTPDRSPDLEKALQYASLLEARVQALEQKLQSSAEETVDRAVERVWQALEIRLQQREAQAPPAVFQSLETISGLRQKSTSAEQSVLDLIAGIGQLFEKPGPRVVRETTPRETTPHEPAPAAAQIHAVPAPAAAPPTPPAHFEPEPAAPVRVEPEPIVAAHMEPEPAAAILTAPAPEPQPEASAEPDPERPFIVKPELAAKAPEAVVEPAPPGQQESTAPVATAVAVEEEIVMEPKLEEKPPVILFKPKDSGRKWRIPFVSSLLMAIAIAWLQFS